MITSKKFQELTTEEVNKFFEYLKAIREGSSDPAIVNMWDNEWEYKNNTLPFILTNTDRFDGVNGEFHVFYNGDEVVACGGVYKSAFSQQVALAGTRTWVDDKYRNKSLLREFMLPLHKQWSIDNKCKAVALSFNQYNKNLISVFKRTRIGERNYRTTSREPHHLFYSGLSEVPFLVDIQFTPQWVIYEKLDPAWNYDWASLSST